MAKRTILLPNLPSRLLRSVDSTISSSPARRIRLRDRLSALCVLTTLALLCVGGRARSGVQAGLSEGRGDPLPLIGCYIDHVRSLRDAKLRSDTVRFYLPTRAAAPASGGQKEAGPYEARMSALPNSRLLTAESATAPNTYVVPLAYFSARGSAAKAAMKAYGYFFVFQPRRPCRLTCKLVWDELANASNKQRMQPAAQQTPRQMTEQKGPSKPGDAAIASWVFRSVPADQPLTVRWVRGDPNDAGWYRLDVRGTFTDNNDPINKTVLFFHQPEIAKPVAPRRGG
jgi:hypothetical protein